MAKPYDVSMKQAIALLTVALLAACSSGKPKAPERVHIEIVQVTGKTPVEPLPEFKAAVLKEMGGGLDEARPMSSVIQTIGGNGSN